MPGCAAKDELTQPRVAVAAHDQQIRTEIRGAREQGFADIGAGLDLFGGLAFDAMSRQRGANVRRSKVLRRFLF